MDNQIDCDPQQYRDEWFDIAIDPVGREFELPNISNTFSHLLVDNSDLTPAQTFNIDVACNTRNGLAISSVSSPNSASQKCVCVSSLRSYNPSGLLVTRKKYQSQVPFSDAFPSNIVTAANQQAHANRGFPNSAACSYPSGSSGQLRHRNPHFESIATNPWSNCSNQNLIRGSMTKVINGQTSHISPRTSQAPSLINIDHSKQPIRIPNIIKNYNVPVYRSVGRLGSSSGLITIKNEEADQLVTNNHFIKPKEEVPDPSQVHNHAIELEDNYSKLEIDQSKTIKTSEVHSDIEGDHQCFVCNVKFATGNALGGHMSSHAKKRKMEVMRNCGGLSIFKSDGPLLISTLDHHEDPQGSPESFSNQPPNETAAITGNDPVTPRTGEKKIEGSKPSNEQDEGSTN